MDNAEKLGRIKARVAMIQEERRKPKRKRVVGLIGSCLRDIDSLLAGVEPIYALSDTAQRGTDVPHAN
ncbi:hypothetical protein [Paraburkholderia sediminicola]|uniref:hypothetical protein n=1 Tax=Paraburkholderia sediminicola TaxID=458836 RepID=UPI0038BC731F